jgi:hypothetical protein
VQETACQNHMNTEVLIKRGKSFAWSAGMMLAALLVDFALQSIGDFGLPTEAVVLLGLILAQVSKHLNSKK